MSRFNAVRSAVCLSNPKTVALTSPAMKKKVHPASSTVFSNVDRLTLIAVHPFDSAPVWARRDRGIFVPSWTKTSPTVIRSRMASHLRTRDRARVMSQPDHRVAADVAIAFPDIRPVGVFLQVEKNAQSALIRALSQHDFVTFTKPITGRLSARHVRVLLRSAILSPVS